MRKFGGYGVLFIIMSATLLWLSCQEKPVEDKIVGQWQNLNHPTVSFKVMKIEGRYSFQVTDSTGTNDYPAEFTNGSWQIGYPFAGAIASYDAVEDRIIIRHGTTEGVYRRLPG